MKHLRLELRADVPESGRQQDGVTLAVFLELDRAQVHVGQQQARAVVLAKVARRGHGRAGSWTSADRSAGSTGSHRGAAPGRRGPRPGCLAVELLLDQGRQRFLFRLAEAPDDQADLRIRDVRLAPRRPCNEAVTHPPRRSRTRRSARSLPVAGRHRGRGVVRHRPRPAIARIGRRGSRPPPPGSKCRHGTVGSAAGR